MQSDGSESKNAGFFLKYCCYFYLSFYKRSQPCPVVGERAALSHILPPWAGPSVLSWPGARLLPSAVLPRGLVFTDIHEGFHETSGSAGDWADLPLPELIVPLTPWQPLPVDQRPLSLLKPARISRWLIFELGAEVFGLQVTFCSFPS